MRSIERSYRDIQAHNPNLGTYPCLVKTVKSRRFSRKSLVKAFNEVMPESEYAKDESKELVDNLEYLTNLPEEGEI